MRIMRSNFWFSLLSPSDLHICLDFRNFCESYFFLEIEWAAFFLKNSKEIFSIPTVTVTPITFPCQQSFKCWLACLAQEPFTWWQILSGCPALANSDGRRMARPASCSSTSNRSGEPHVSPLPSNHRSTKTESKLQTGNMCALSSRSFCLRR